MMLSLDRWIGKVAVVTGASAGIGAELCKQLVKNGIKVAGLARRQDRIQAMAEELTGEKGKLIAIKCDLTQEHEILAAFETVKEKLGPVSILVNNAGLLRQSNLIDGDTESWKLTLDTNVLGLCIATREAIKQMRENNIDGHIIHINSVVGHKVFPLPGANVYAGTKHAVTALAETLRHELNANNLMIKITSISPGFVHTEFAHHAFGEKAAIISNSVPGLEGKDVAEAVIYVLSTPPHVNITEVTMQVVGEKF